MDAIDNLNQALQKLSQEGVIVKVGKMYNATGYNYFIALPSTVKLNGNGFEMEHRQNGQEQ